MAGHHLSCGARGGKSITFTIRSGVKWSNGTPMTPADVAFTYNYIKKNPAINLAGLNIGTVTSSGDTVTVTFPTPQYTNLENIAGVAILPESIWGSIKDPSTFTDSDPIGTGPYTLGSFTPSGFTLVKNPNYWQPSKVQVPKVYFPVYSSNTGALSALFAGQIDWTGNYIPNLQRDFVDTNPADPPLLGGGGQLQRPVAEPERVADQPVPGPEGDRPGHQPDR